MKTLKRLFTSFIALAVIITFVTPTNAFIVESTLSEYTVKDLSIKAINAYHGEHVKPEDIHPNQ